MWYLREREAPLRGHLLLDLGYLEWSYGVEIPAVQNHDRGLYSSLGISSVAPLLFEIRPIEFLSHGKIHGVFIVATPSDIYRFIEFAVLFVRPD